jgi:hypothetical protein
VGLGEAGGVYEIGLQSQFTEQEIAGRRERGSGDRRLY